jgi:hypothetical protein
MTGVGVLVGGGVGPGVGGVLDDGVGVGGKPAADGAVFPAYSEVMCG